MAACKHCGVGNLTWVETSSGFRLAVWSVTPEEAVRLKQGVEKVSQEFLDVHGYPDAVLDAATGQSWASHACTRGFEAWKDKRGIR